MFPAEKFFEVNDAMREALMQSAISQVKIALEIAVPNKKDKIEAAKKQYKITGLQVPARPVSR